MDRIQFIVDRLNARPFSKGFATLADFDSKSSLELLELACEVIVEIDPDQEGILREPTEYKVQGLIHFLNIMKFNIPDDQAEDFYNMLSNGDNETLHDIMHWCLQRFDHLKKRAYLAKYLMPLEVPPEFMNEELIIGLSEDLRAMQAEFKEVHKEVDQLRTTHGTRPAELKSEIAQLEQERTQLRGKIEKMEKEAKKEGPGFNEMLKVTSALRREQEEEVRLFDRLREYRKLLTEADTRLAETNRRLSELRSSGAQSQSAEQLLQKLQKDVRDMAERRETLETTVAERKVHLEKLTGWDSNDRNATEDDVRAKRDQVQDMEEQVGALQENLEAALERNTKLVVFRQASTIAMKKMREREDEIEKLTEEKRRLTKQMEEKNNELRAKGKLGGKTGQITQDDLKRYGAEVKNKVEKYKTMRKEQDMLRGELVVLQRTEQILKSRNKNLDDFLADLERKKGIEGYRDTQRALAEMAEKASEVDQMKGATLEQISAMVEEIGREFKKKQAQLGPMMAELKRVRQEYMDIESEYAERKSSYDKVAVGLELEKQALERECDQYQDECLREESRFHQLTNMATIARIKLDRADQEKKWQAGNGKLMRDFASFKEFYQNKLMAQEQATKQLRKKQKELKEEYGARTNQKTNFNNLYALLEAKLQVEEAQGNVPGAQSGPSSRNHSAGYNGRGGGGGGGGGPGGGGGNYMSLEDEY